MSRLYYQFVVSITEEERGEGGGGDGYTLT